MSASPEHGGKCRALRGDRGKSAYTSQNHSFVSIHAYPFRRLRRHLPRSRGRLFCESFPYFSILLILFSILLCLPTLTPFVNLSVDTLAKAKRLTHFYSVAPIPGKWFACFPSSGDGLRLAYFPFSPSCRDGFFYLIRFFIFGLFPVKKPDFFFPGKLK